MRSAMHTTFARIQRLLAALCFLAGISYIGYSQPGDIPSYGRLERYGPQAAAPAGAPNPLVDSLVAYYGMEESSGTRYDSHGSNHLTAYNNPGDTAGVIGRAARFDSQQSQYLRSTSPALAVGDGDWSLMFWARVYEPGSVDIRTLISRGTGISCSAIEYIFVVQSSTGIVRVCDGSTRQSTNGVDTVYFHTAIVFDRAIDSLRVYINGSHIATTYIPNQVFLSSPFTIGATGSNTYPQYGTIDEVFYWRGYSVSAAFINWYYNGGQGNTYTNVKSY